MVGESSFACPQITASRFTRKGIEEKRFDFYPGLKRWENVAKFGGVDYRLKAEAPAFEAGDAEDAKSILH